MPAAIRIDTLKYAKRLTSAGLSEQVAEAIVEGLSEADTSDLATKSDLADLRAELKAEIADLRTRFAQLQTDIAELRADLFSRLWVMGLGIVGSTVALMKILP